MKCCICMQISLLSSFGKSPQYQTEYDKTTKCVIESQDAQGKRWEKYLRREGERGLPFWVIIFSRRLISSQNKS